MLKVSPLDIKVPTTYLCCLQNLWEDSGKLIQEASHLHWYPRHSPVWLQTICIIQIAIGWSSINATRAMDRGKLNGRSAWVTSDHWHCWWCSAAENTIIGLTYWRLWYVNIWYTKYFNLYKTGLQCTQNMDKRNICEIVIVYKYMEIQ